LGGLAKSYSITVFRSSTGQSTQSPPEGKRLNKPGHASVSPPNQQYQLCQYHYISFSSSSSPPRVDSSPGMTLPRPFNRREEGRPPTGCRLQKYHRFKIPSMSDERRQRKTLLRDWIVVLVKFCYKKGSTEANYTSCKQLPLLQS